MGRTDAKECWDCKECFPLCPTSALQAAYVLAGALMTPPEEAHSGGCGCSCSCGSAPEEQAG